jgi:zinc protease
MAAPAAPAKTTGDVLPFKATEKTLANGLKIIVVPTGLPNLAPVTIPVQTGSRNEVEPGKSGFANVEKGRPRAPLLTIKTNELTW